jgi:hypothetical protein
MSDTNKINYANGGSGFLGLLTLLFIHHKLIGTITWSWWWVLSPLWISAAILLAVAAVLLLLVLVKNNIK